MKHNGSAELCFTDMLDLWLRTSQRPMLADLKAALASKTVNYHQLAEESTMDDLQHDKTKNHETASTTTWIAIAIAIAICLYLLSGPSTSTHTCGCLSLKDSYVKGVETLVATIGETANATLHLINHKGNTYIGEVENVTCEMIRKSTGEISKCEAKKSTGNQYEISYKATSRGRHQLHIKVEGEHIKGSPFNVTVKMPVQKLGTPIRIITGMKVSCGVAVNQRGEIIVVEHRGHCISIFSPAGEKLQSIGSEGSGPGQFSYPRGVTVDNNDNILVADTFNHRIQMLSHNHTFTTTVESKDNNSRMFLSGIAISPTTKNIVISGTENNRVQILNPDLTFNSSIGSKGNGSGQFRSPHSVAFDSAGNMYVTDYGNHRIQVFNPKGIYLRQFEKKGSSNGELNFPTGICIDSTDTVYVVEEGNNCVSVFTHEGTFLTSFGSEGDGPGQFKEPCEITVDKNGLIYVADAGNNRVQIF